MKLENPYHGRQEAGSAGQYKALGVYKYLESYPAIQLSYALLRARVKDAMSMIIFIYISEKSPLQLSTQDARCELGAAAASLLLKTSNKHGHS